MPKQKTHRGSAKRFKRTGGGGLKRSQAFTSHRFHGKTKKQRRHLRKQTMVHATDIKRIKSNALIQHANYYIFEQSQETDRPRRN